MNDFLDVPEILTPQIQELVKQIDGLVQQLKTLGHTSPSPRVSAAFGHLEILSKEGQNFSTKSILKLHELIGEEGRFRKPISFFFDENNIGIRGYHPAQAEDLEKIFDAYIAKYHPDCSREKPLLKIAGAYLTFALIHPFKDGNGRVGRLIAAWLMNAYGYNVLAPHLEGWMGNENREHGKAFESKIHNYLA